MKIYINGRFLTQKMMGINRFAFEMCRALQKEGLDFEILIPEETCDCYDTSSFNITPIKFFSSHLWEQITLPLYLLLKKDYILINFSGLGPVLCKKQIITIHDLAFLENPNWYSKGYYYIYKLLTPIAARNARKIFTVSNFSKHEITSKLHINEYKIEIIYNAISEEINKGKDDTPIASEKYILSVASIDPRKNFGQLLKAYLKSGIKTPLYIAGSKNKVFGESGISSESIQNVKLLGYVSDADLKRYYAQAELFIYPSLYEGFGIPPLEAISNNCPVIISDIPVFKEIYKDSVCYVNPLSDEDIAEKMKLLVNNNEKREELRAKGENILSLYSWKKSAIKAIEVIKECMN
ncbi:MAG: glycosyltransferase family 4 protein [Paludibacteraceae bacterium]|nr:glycosyltransferase family 4 protein [Paludibacteraceae bacterium]